MRQKKKVKCTTVKPTLEMNVDDSNWPSDPGMCSNPLSAVMQSSLVRHICHSARLTCMCRLYSRSASSTANGTSLASLSKRFRENGNKNGRV